MALVARLTVPEPEVDRALDLLLAVGADAVELEDGAVLGLFHEVDPRALAARVEAAGLPAPAVEPAHMLDWDSVWAPAVRPFRVGPLTVAPGGAPAPDRLAIGLGAFGSGLHVTTRLCLQRLVEYPPRGTVLDVGVGTGVLALAALRLGADRAVGVDNDPAAVAVARDNAVRNDLAHRFVATTVPVAALGMRFDRIVANLLAAPLIEMADALVPALASGGELSLSGFPAGQADEVAAAFVHLGARRLPGAEEDGWARVDLAAPW